MADQVAWSLGPPDSHTHDEGLRAGESVRDNARETAPMVLRPWQVFSKG